MTTLSLLRKTSIIVRIATFVTFAQNRARNHLWEAREAWNRAKVTKSDDSGLLSDKSDER